MHVKMLIVHQETHQCPERVRGFPDMAVAGYTAAHAKH